jgi:N-acetylglucosamine-6-phosphate deacetylase
MRLRTLIKSNLLITPQREIQRGAVLIENKKILWAGPEGGLPATIEAKTIDLGEKIIAPGFVDIHLHGFGGRMTFGSQEDLLTIASSLAKYGTTSFLPTIDGVGNLSTLLEKLAQIREVMGKEKNAAQILGIHLEGPFLSAQEPAVGAQRADWLRAPSLVELEQMHQSAGGALRYMTIAPELEGAMKVIKKLNSFGIVASAGHSMASYEEIAKAIDLGLRSICHMFNGMPPLHHRRAGLVGAALLRSELNAELIGDGQHVGKEAMQILLQCKGVDGITLVTDNSQLTGLPSGRYKDVNGSLRIKTEFRCTNEEGRLAGSVMPLNTMVKTVMDLTGCSLAQVVQMASLNPARLLGFSNKGSIEKGKDADLVAFDQGLNVNWAMIGGKIMEFGV